MKRAIVAVALIFVLWSALDFVIHGIVLSKAYQSTAALWRPMDEMKMYLIYTSTFLLAVAFVSIYVLFVEEKRVGTGVKYGLLFGLGVGISMGYGTYAVMPIPYHMAFTWFLGTVIESTLAGIIVGLVVKD
jgi:hypothetical protein